MWDTYNTSSHHDRLVPYDKKVTITENKAATDQSVSLLQEMQTAAKKSLLDSFMLKSSSLNMAVMIYDNRSMDRYEACYKFIINGEEVQGEEIITKWDFGDDYNTQCIDAITNKIIKSAATTIVRYFKLELEHVTRKKSLYNAMLNKGIYMKEDEALVTNY